MLKGTSFLQDSRPRPSSVPSSRQSFLTRLLPQMNNSCYLEPELLSYFHVVIKDEQIFALNGKQESSFYRLWAFLPLRT
jgi:hypothetical protein